MAREKERKATVEEVTNGSDIALNAAIDAINKQFGKGAIMRLDKDAAIEQVEVTPTGSLGLDAALGVGGIPRGRIVEILGPEASGKTTLTLQILAAAQKAGGTVAFIDAEHALDMAYAQRLGVDTNKLLLSQPMSGNEALEIVDTLARSGAVSIIVVDSVAALTPKEELEGEMGQSFMGLQARLMSQALRKLTAVTSKSNTTIIFINQIRMKIGVMFGCLHYDTLVNFSDGRSIPIGKVVDERICGNVYSFNEEKYVIEEKSIIDWHDNGSIEKEDDFVHIQTQSIDGGGRFGLTVTPEHKVLTGKGWKTAGELSYEDNLVSKYEETISGSYGEFLRGILVGDSTISIRDKSTASIRLQDNTNLSYINWKLDKLSSFLNFTEVAVKSGYRYDSEYTYELAKLGYSLDNRDPLYMLRQYSDLSLALWIMDDGHYDSNNSHSRYSISVKRFKNNKDKLTSVTNTLNSLGLYCDFNLRTGAINFKTSITDDVANRISKYIPACMQYKLPEDYKGKYEEFSLHSIPTLITEQVRIKELRNASPRQLRNKRKFDITVEDNHNYMVGGKYNGVIVHNSPETTPGGNALKFYCSVRLDIRKLAAIKEDEATIGNKVRVKVIKNKVAPPFKECEFDLLYGKGIDKVGEIVDLSENCGIIEKSGAWYKYNGANIGQGRDKTIDYLENNENVRFEIERKLKEIK